MFFIQLPLAVEPLSRIFLSMHTVLSVTERRGIRRCLVPAVLTDCQTDDVPQKSGLIG